MHATTATRPVQPGQAVQRAASIQRAALQQLASVRVTGTLLQPGQITATPGSVPTYTLHLLFEPRHGLPYEARMQLGTDPQAARSALPHLTTGALISVAGDALELVTDHGLAVLALRGARDLVIPLDLISTPPQEG